MNILPSSRYRRAIDYLGASSKRVVIVVALLSALVLSIILIWWTSTEVPDRSSTDIGAMKRLIDLQFPYTEAHWELVSTPDYHGGVPGPTDYITLVAEIGPRDDQKFSSLPMAAPLHALPNTARNWMNPKSRILLDTADADSPAPAVHPECRTVTGILSRSSQTVSGHLCNSADRMLLYMVVVDYTTVTP